MTKNVDHNILVTQKGEAEAGLKNKEGGNKQEG